MTKRILINGYRTGVYGDTSANTEYILQWGMKQGIVKMKDLSKKRKIFYQNSHNFSFFVTAAVLHLQFNAFLSASRFFLITEK